MRLDRFNMLKSFSILLFLVFFYPLTLYSQESISIHRISGTIALDGTLNEEAWNEASVFPMIVHSPHFGAEPSERSEVMVGYDEEFLWVGARL